MLRQAPSRLAAMRRRMDSTRMLRMARLAVALFGPGGAGGDAARALPALAADDRLDAAKAWFADLWSRLAAFARAEPDTFRFLEMQDHAPYLDAESRKTELEVLGPIWLAGQALREQRLTRDLPIEILIALVWGALVGLLKAERLGYFALSDDMIERAGEACWDAVRARQTSPSKSKRRKV